ncbi:MAG: hypothetical protein ACO4CG_14020 [Prochlorothrix sp.]|nr:hypothetical protein [Prochlorothrix sp.]
MSQVPVPFSLTHAMTSDRIVWYQGTDSPSAALDFAEIQQWWAGLQGREVVWQQRAISGTQDWSQLDWSSQRFDERFFIKDPEIRGITLFWAKANEADRAQSTTPHRLEWDVNSQCLYIFPQSQQGLVVRVSLPQIEYRTVTLTNPEVDRSIAQGSLTLTFKDANQRLAVQVTLNAEALLALKRQLP